MPSRLWLLVLPGLLGPVYGHAREEGKPALPEPLTLEYALSLATEDHPTLLGSRYLLDGKIALRQQAEAADDYSASLTARARWIDLPSGAPVPGITDDHAVGVTVIKPLLDSGLSASQSKAATLFEEAARLKYRAALQQRRELIMRRFFDVQLADLQFFRENERMATAFISLDRARTRQQLGQGEELEILKLEREYQKVRRDRYYFEGQQRITRARLAEALNRPGMLPSTLNKPVLPELDRTPPEVERLQFWARQYNPDLQALRQELAGSIESLQAAHARNGLRLDAELSYNSYTFQPSARENWRAGINFSYPLSLGGRSDADIALALSQKHQAQNRLQEAENKLDQAVLEAWMGLGSLRIERLEMQALSDYAGFYLDRTRTIYEQGLQTTLGDAMTRITDAEWRLAQTEFEMAMLWARLEGMVGLPFNQFPGEENK